VDKQLAACDCVLRYDFQRCCWVCALCERHITDEELYRRGLDIAQEVVNTDG